MQAAEALPPVIRLAADVAAGGDTKKLFKMMEDGLLDPNTLIPAITKRMREDSDKEMGAFWESLRYNQGMALRAQQEFTRKFLESGGEKGLTRFFETWSTIVKNSMESTELLGAAFNKLSWGFSVALLAGSEFAQWVAGREKEGNFMTVIFGPSGENGFLSEIRTTIKEAKDIISTLFTDTGYATSYLKQDLETILESLGWMLKRLNESLRIIKGFNQGGVKGALRAAELNSYIWAAEDYVDSEAAKNGEVLTLTERKRRVDKLVSDWEERNPAPKEETSVATKTLNYVVAGPLRATRDALFGEGGPLNFGSEEGVTYPNATGVIPVIKPKVDDVTQPSPVPLNLPRSLGVTGMGNFGLIHNAGQQVTRLDIVMSGKIGVEGAVSDDITFSDSIKSRFQVFLQDYLGNALTVAPQPSN